MPSPSKASLAFTEDMESLIEVVLAGAEKTIGKKAKAKDIQDAVLAVAQLVQSNYTLKEALETL